ncbi:hypothetical protein [Microbacterium testaceum]|uniref:hypothetical protein n=1 Tax=Microbacterium testaceum TaxID=2033 RepID=UPI0012487905|nr:hypothetical protein [Microbacterium testaceum]
MSRFAGEETQSIEVPARFAAQVAQLVAMLKAHPKVQKELARVIADGTVSQPMRPDYPLWDDADIIALANSRTKTAGNYRAIMDAIIREDHVDEWVAVSQLSEWTGLEVSEVRAFRTHLYRHIHAHFGGKYADAPFTGAWGTELSPSRGRAVYYRVSKECAYQWERVQDSLIH